MPPVNENIESYNAMIEYAEKAEVKNAEIRDTHKDIRMKGELLRIVFQDDMVFLTEPVTLDYV